MPRLFFVLAFVACLAAALGLQHAWNSDAATGPATIRITSRQISDLRIDGGRPGRGAGDTQVIRQSLFNRRITSKPIGHANVVCTYTGRTMRTCMATIFLPKGKLVAGGSIQFPELFDLASLGGTRLYDNARGTLTVIRTTQRPRRNILVFRLAG